MYRRDKQNSKGKQETWQEVGRCAISWVTVEADTSSLKSANLGKAQVQQKTL